MRIHQCLSVVIIFRLMILLQKINNLWGKKNYSCEINKNENDQSIITIRSPLEESIEYGIEVSKYLKQQFQLLIGESSMNQLNDKKLSCVLNKFKIQIHAIVPGTRWCGDGNIAINDEDIGIFRDTDACCRQHDKCQFFIESGQICGPLKNNGLFTRSMCECDHEFYYCLKNAQDSLAYDIGYTYFNVLRPQCVDYYYPIVSCRKRQCSSDGLWDCMTMGKCVEYEYDMSQPMTLQWKDSPDF